MILMEATPEMSRARDRDTYGAWGGPLPMAAYLHLEWRLRNHPWPRAAQTLWLLGAEDGEVLASCETYRMPSLRSDGPAPGHSYGVASVYTEPHKRRRGHVTELLTRLAGHLASRDPLAQALFLYSDVPLAVYLRSGFVARPALNLAFAAMPGDPGQGVDELLPEHRAAQALAAMAPPEGAFAILPDADQVDWHLERERIFASVMGRSRPPACGARLGAACALWAAEYRTGQLMVLLLHAPGPGEAEALLTCARRTAHAAGLTRAVLWKTPRDGPWPEARLEDRAERLDSVPMILPLDARVRAADWEWIPRVLWV
jgi:Acetyltransferase (GNAT) domain